MHHEIGWPWEQPEDEKPCKPEEVNIIDQCGYEFVRKPIRLAHFMPGSFAVNVVSSAHVHMVGSSQV